MCPTFSVRQLPAIFLVVSVGVEGTWVLSLLVLSPGHLQSVNGLQSYWWCSRCHLLVGEKVGCQLVLCQDGGPGVDGRALACQSEQQVASSGL